MQIRELNEQDLAAGFYKKLGARFLGDIASSIPGRTIPEFETLIHK